MELFSFTPFSSREITDHLRRVQNLLRSIGLDPQGWDNLSSGRDPIPPLRGLLTEIEKVDNKPKIAFLILTFYSVFAVLGFSRRWEDQFLQTLSLRLQELGENGLYVGHLCGVPQEKKTCSLRNYLEETDQAVPIELIPVLETDLRPSRVVPRLDIEIIDLTEPSKAKSDLHSLDRSSRVDPHSLPVARITSSRIDLSTLPVRRCFHPVDVPDDEFVICDDCGSWVARCDGCSGIFTEGTLQKFRGLRGEWFCSKCLDRYQQKNKLGVYRPNATTGQACQDYSYFRRTRDRLAETAFWDAEIARADEESDKDYDPDGEESETSSDESETSEDAGEDQSESEEEDRWRLRRLVQPRLQRQDLDRLQEEGSRQKREKTNSLFRRRGLRRKRARSPSTESSEDSP